MSTKTLTCTLVLTLLGVCAAQAGDQPTTVTLPPPAPLPAGMSPTTPQVPPSGPSEVAPPLGPLPGGPHSSGCCGPIGGNGLVESELFVRSGVSLTAGGGFLNKVLDTGWMSEIGGRSLFFNADDDAAWTAELSLSYTYNNGTHGDQTVSIIAGQANPTLGLSGVSAQAASVSTLNRTYGNAGIGREFYLRGLAHQEGMHWRVGADVGMRYGTTRLDLHDYDPSQPSTYLRLNKWGYGVYGSLHSDLEVPCGCCTWLFGFRAEIDEDFMHQLIPGQKNYLTDVNLLANIGVRF